MKLHESEELFKDAIQATAEHLRLQNIFIEKDYWLTLALYRIAQTDLADATVFKGGTSLSKAYGCIERFSEDVDLAVITDKDRPANQTKKLLKRITTVASVDLKEELEGSSKGSMIRKIYYSYPKSFDGTFGPISNKILLEVNAFAHPSPAQPMPISTYIHDFLKSRGQDEIIKQFDLQPFPFQVLCLERTFTEKVMAIVKASCSETPIESLRQKIRHIYDIHQLMQREEIQTFVDSPDFHELLEVVRKYDQEAPVGDAKWIDMDIAECPIFADTENVWKSLNSAYRDGLGAIVYGELPAEGDVLESLMKIGVICRSN
ncbi:nucleotidyl transferase AbiEii/AbiGii toxin family protein [Maridesulfovibrio frigidus]|uniref:nucleotidyl transferase AbiEii/AbiGii toxin family protein n=1 Tax=Maridesulfovibrio frigidus TaxID=340956 RepID=UPI0004E19ADC|nr:nucleotidyl transferase AbiEii/AbiGii toxin family protein [Maridesulfovibrio frigidus]